MNRRERPMRLVILISGRGSNMLAIVQSLRQEDWPVEVVGVLSNDPQAEGLAAAAAHGLFTHAVSHQDYGSRESFDEALARQIDPLEPDLVVLAGFMRVLTAAFCERYAGRLLNIHPSLLPAFPGLKTHERALEVSCCLHGATVHAVTPGLDQGPALAQAVIPVHANDTPATLAARLLPMEHRLYPHAIALVLSGQATWQGGGWQWADQPTRDGFGKASRPRWLLHPELLSQTLFEQE